MNEKRIIHVASFRGNIGDIINHKGFYETYIDINKQNIDRVEIRDFYFSKEDKKLFDEDMIRKINKHDLLLLGGGGFFDLKWENSDTGTTLNFSDYFIESISAKVVINSMGYHEYPGITTIAMIEKFKNFLEKCIEHNWLITVRNDGSYERIISRYNNIPQIANYVHKVPDSGFFCKYRNTSKKIGNKISIGLCITNDLFCKKYNGVINEEVFNESIAQLINLKSEDYLFVFFPHVPSDLRIINNILKNVNSSVCRERIIVAPYDSTSDYSVDRLAWYYKQCDCIVGMRFHSLIQGINLRIPSIALSGHEQISSLFSDLGLVSYCIKVDEDFSIKKLENKIDYCIDNRESFKRQYNYIYSKLSEQRENYKNLLNQYI